MKPVIGISALPSSELRVHRTNTSYITAVERAGGIPVLLPVTEDLTDAGQLASRIDGLLVPGGPDVSPLLYGEEPAPQIGATCRQNDSYEFALIRAVRAAEKPVLGICRGLQILNVCYGGTLWQDLLTQTDSGICHLQSKLIRSERTHSVTITSGSVLASVLGTTKTTVNTYHHQAVREVADGFTVCARANDGIAEAIECGDALLAVQWHPEELQEHYAEAARLFSWLIKHAGG